MYLIMSKKPKRPVSDHTSLEVGAYFAGETSHEILVCQY